MRMPLKLYAVALFALVLLLQGCSDDDNSSLREYQVDLTNLTHNQAIAPVGVILHGAGFQPFVLGAAASEGLEQLAEGGDNTMFLGDAAADSAVLDTAAGAAVIAPGGHERFAVGDSSDSPHLSLAGMLVNTNDGFAALNSINLSSLTNGSSLTLYANVYDSGTEGNSEAASDLPGQGGEGFNTARDDHDFVAVHPGVIGHDDGLTTSALDQSHRFDNPALRIVVTRVQ